jgi:hypothetical protein
MFHTHSFIFSLSSLPPAKKRKKEKLAHGVCLLCSFSVSIEKGKKNKKNFHKRAAHGSTGVQTGKGPPQCN